MSMVHVGRVTGVSRPTLYELRAKYGEGAIDFNFTVLDTLARRGSMSISELKHRLGDSVGEHLADFQRQDLLDVEPEPTADGYIGVVAITPQGLELLEHWRLHIDEREAEDEL